MGDGKGVNGILWNTIYKRVFKHACPQNRRVVWSVILAEKNGKET